MFSIWQGRSIYNQWKSIYPLDCYRETLEKLPGSYWYHRIMVHSSCYNGIELKRMIWNCLPLLIGQSLHWMWTKSLSMTLDWNIKMTDHTSSAIIWRGRSARRFWGWQWLSWPELSSPAICPAKAQRREIWTTWQQQGLVLLSFLYNF